MQRDTDQDWVSIGEADPFFGVLGDHRFHINRVDEALLDEFYAGGEVEIAELLQRLQSAVPGFTPTTALDFGCGAGRHVLAMARHIPHASGLDVSPGMIARAEAAAQARGRTNTTFMNALPDTERYDWISSYQAFQHIPPPHGYALLEQLLDRLELGGTCSLQFTLFRDARHIPLHDGRYWTYNGSAADALAMKSTEGLGHIALYDYNLNNLLAILLAHDVELRAITMTERGGHHGAWLFGRKDPAALVIRPGLAYGAGTSPGLARFVGAGWSAIEEWGVWTSGPISTITVRIPPETRQTHVLRLHGKAFVVPTHPQVLIEAFVNDHLAASRSFTEATTQTIEIGLEAAAPNGLVSVRLVIHSPASPVDCGIGIDDDRKLGFGLEHITLDLRAE